MHERPLPPLARLGVRRDYVLEPREFDALGGHDPDDLGCIVDPKPTGGWPSPVWDAPMQDQQLIRLHRCPEGFGLANANVAHVWIAVGARLGIHWLSIHWPDQHYPEFTAVPR